MDLNRKDDSKSRRFHSKPSWVMVFPYSDNPKKKGKTDQVRNEVLCRLKAASLEVASLLNIQKTEVHVVLSAEIERLEREAEKAGLKKVVRCSGGLARFTGEKRHLFGPYVLDETRFFTAIERQELILRIVRSNQRFYGAGIDIQALLGDYDAASLVALKPGQLSALELLLTSGERDDAAQLTERSVNQRDKLVQTVLDRLKAGPYIKAMLPLHDRRAQEDLAQTFANWWLMCPQHLSAPRERQGSLLETIQKCQSDARTGGALLNSNVMLHDAAVLFAMHMSSAPLNVEKGVIGLAAAMWFNKYVSHWARTSAHLMHRWGQSKEAFEMGEVSLRSACSASAELEKFQMLTSDNIKERKQQRGRRVLMQLTVLGALNICCIFIFLGVRWLRSIIFGDVMTGNMVLSMALIDVLRIYVMQLVGRFVLQALAQWDDDIRSSDDRSAWQITKYVLYELCNNFCSIALSVGYQAFAAGTTWQLVAAPICWDRPYCQLDIEIHVWTIVIIKYISVPLAVWTYHIFSYLALRRRLRQQRLKRTLDATAMSNARKGAAGAKKVAGGRATTIDPATGKTVVVGSNWFVRLLTGQKASQLPITLEYDDEGLYGETPAEAQQLLRPYDAYVWEIRRPLDLVLLVAFVGLTSTLAPLLPLAAVVTVWLKLRMDALELLVTTQRAPCRRDLTCAFWTQVLSWLALLAVFACSICIMFSIPDVDAVIQKLATSYREYLMMNPQFRGGRNCLGGICLDLDASTPFKAEGSLYWIIWVWIVAIGLLTRTLSQVIFRLPSLWILRHLQVESQVQGLLGLGPTHSSEQEAALTLEEYTARYQKLSVDPNKFEKAPC